MIKICTYFNFNILINIFKKFYFFLTFICLIIVLVACLYLYHDPSWKNQAEYASSAQQFQFKSYGLGDVWLISYADLEPIYIANQNSLHKAGIDYGFKFHKLYRKENIELNYYSRHKNIFSQNRGSGYWLWKPYFILKTLESMPENDVLVYLDGGVYPISRLDNLIQELKHKDILLFENNHTHRSKTKRYLLKLMDKDNNQVRDSLQMQASFVFLKNTEFTRDFIKQWLQISEDPFALTDLPSEEEYSDFEDHRHDQSILSLLYLDHQQKIITKTFIDAKKYFFHHRKRFIRKNRPQELYLKIKAFMYKAKLYIVKLQG